MKIFKTIFALAALALAIAACSKGELQEKPAQNGNISVEITGSLGELLPADDTKGSVSSIVRLDWTGGDVAYAFDATKCLGSLTASVDPNNKTVAKLSGTISEPEGSIITIIYTNISDAQPAIAGGKISFDFSEQTLDKIPFVAYGTIASEAVTTQLSDLTIPFSFASSVMKVSATGLNDAAIDEVFPGGVNTVCELTLSNTDAPEIAGTTVGNITLTKGSNSFSLAEGKTIVNFGVVKTGSDVSSDTRDITFKQGGDYKWSKLLNNYEIKEQKAINTVVDTYVRVPYVEIEADYDLDPSTPATKLKWYKENLTLTDSGKRLFKGLREDGTNTGHINGDYFQWAAHENYALPVNDFCNGNTDKGLLLYTSFTTKRCVGGGKSSNIEFKKVPDQPNLNYEFSNIDAPKRNGFGISPYRNKTEKNYTKYNSFGATLEMIDDAANIILGGSWRMPTTTEFQALYKVTYWAYDLTDRGCYVYAPNPLTDAGKYNDGTGTYNKSNALLFFPAAAFVSSHVITSDGYGYYLSSSLATSTVGSAYCIAYQSASKAVDTQNLQSRYLGFTIRPVSD